MENNARIWGIHTMDDSLFLNQNIIAIGWDTIGDLSRIEPTREAYKNEYIRAYPNAKKGSVATGAGMLYRFSCEMQKGDYIVFHQRLTVKSILV